MSSFIDGIAPVLRVIGCVRRRKDCWRPSWLRVSLRPADYHFPHGNPGSRPSAHASRFFGRHRDRFVRLCGAHFAVVTAHALRTPVNALAFAGYEILDIALGAVADPGGRPGCPDTRPFV